MKDLRNRYLIVETPGEAAHDTAFLLAAYSKRRADYAKRGLIALMYGLRLPGVWDDTREIISMAHDLTMEGRVTVAHKSKFLALLEDPQKYASRRFRMLAEAALNGPSAPIIDEGVMVKDFAGKLPTEAVILDKWGYVSASSDQNLEPIVNMSLPDGPVVHETALHIQKNCLDQGYDINSHLTHYPLRKEKKPRSQERITTKVMIELACFTLGCTVDGTFSPSATILPQGYFPAPNPNVTWTVQDATTN
jgi:hypothetical protein